MEYNSFAWPFYAASSVFSPKSYSFEPISHSVDLFSHSYSPINQSVSIICTPFVLLPSAVWFCICLVFVLVVTFFLFSPMWHITIRHALSLLIFVPNYLMTNFHKTLLDCLPMAIYTPNLALEVSKSISKFNCKIHSLRPGSLTLLHSTFSSSFELQQLWKLHPSSVNLE